MIPSIFARAVEKDIWVLGICADYLEDRGGNGSILRLIADNYFLLDDSAYTYEYDIIEDNYASCEGLPTVSGKLGKTYPILEQNLAKSMILPPKNRTNPAI